MDTVADQRFDKAEAAGGLAELARSMAEQKTLGHKFHFSRKPRKSKHAHQRGYPPRLSCLFRAHRLGAFAAVAGPRLPPSRPGEPPDLPKSARCGKKVWFPEVDPENWTIC